MHYSPIQSIAFASLLLCLSSCDSDVVNSSGYTVSGTISAAQGTDVDSDIQDPNQQQISNNTKRTPQSLIAPVSLNGYLDGESDPIDIYQVTLNKGDRITLKSAEDSYFDKVFVLSYESLDGSQTEYSTGSQYSQLTIEEHGTYFIKIEATTYSMGKYTLSIGDSPELTGILSTQQEFVSNQFIYHPKTSNKTTIQADKQQKLSNTLESYSLSSLAGSGKLQLIGKPKKAKQKTNSSAANSQLTEVEEKYATLLQLIELKKALGSDAVSLNYRYHALMVPDDPLYSSQWDFPLISLPQAWDLTDGSVDNGDPVIVAVIDTGVYLEHDDLKDKLIAGYDFYSDTTNDNDDEPGIDDNPDDPGDGTSLYSNSWHGTHVAGTIAASTNNAIGVAGVSPGAVIMPIRVLGVDGGTSYDIMQAIRYAAGLTNDSGTVPDKAADVINLSLGGRQYEEELQTLIDEIVNDGDGTTIIVAAAGNEASSMSFYPAAYDGVLSVSAVDANKNLAPYSNYGSTIDIAAPGGDLSADLTGDGEADGILSCLVSLSGGVKSADYGAYQGTSMAAPHVAGVIALMKSVYPQMSNAQFNALLNNNELTDDLGNSGRDNAFGYGLINAFDAVYAAQSLTDNTQTILTADPYSFTLSSNDLQQIIEIRQIGTTETLTLSSIESSESWLTVTPNSTTEDGELGEYLAEADITDLDEGSYHAIIRITASNGYTLTLSVTLSLRSTDSSLPNADTGTLYLLLLDKNENVIDMAGPLTGRDGSYSFSLANISEGEYYLVAGSDIDNDDYICGESESCGAWPLLSRYQPLTVDDNLSGINFTVSIDSVLWQQQSSNSHTQRFSIPK